MASSRMNPQRGISSRADRRTTVPRWFAAMAAVYGTAVTFLAVAFLLGASTWSHSASGSAIADGFARWWPSASLAAAIVAIVLVTFGAAASRRRRTRARVPRI
ncbi:hypothetical protein QNM97_22195 [Gordonia sp. L191]|uniref:hypothetical protein n=1 Tax=Gordonia sp. L191 TaxID=2982699 RepID=UPI0024BF22AC|nr:hypothetical protein [Gordonia sp. L191]WHU46657.1 hypothetical protein QNM97_22195 [Gordonia sp. L191]